MPFRAVRRLAEVSPALPSYAIIGGLAEIVRLGQAHRATNDVDTVSDDQAGLVDVLVAEGLERQGDSVWLDPVVKLDVIDVSEGDPDCVPFLTHRFAFDTRTELELIVRTRDGASGAAASLSVARASALVAVKLGISEGAGRPRDPRKVGSDAFDIARLLQRFGPDALADELATLADARLLIEVRRLALRHLVEDADATAAAIARSAVQGVQSVHAEQIEILGRAFYRRLESPAAT